MTKAKNSHIIVKREVDLNYTHKTDYMFPSETNAKELENNLFRSIEFFKLFKNPKNINSLDLFLRSKALNGQPNSLYVKTLVVTELSWINKMRNYTQISDNDTLFEYMRIYLTHHMNGVCYF